MAVNKVSSKQLMGLLDESRNRISSLENNMATMKLNLDNRLSVIRNMQELEQQRMIELTSLLENGKWIEQASKIVLPRADIVEGVYTQFGSTVHSRFLKDPTDVFNFKTVSGYTYKNNATFTINDVSKPKYIAALMNDSITGQDICFEEFDTPDINVSIKVNPSELLGTTECNIVEIVPYLPGSFDIDTFELFSLQGYYTGDVVADSEMPNKIPSVGVCRLMLDDVYNLYELRMNIHLRFQNSNGRYPFGLKHLYFLNASMNVDSYIVAKITQNKYIDTISEDLAIVDQTGTVATTCKDENITLWLDWSNGVGIDSISTSKGLTSNPIPRDVKEFFVHMPIQRSTTSLQFNSITLR